MFQVVAGLCHSAPSLLAAGGVVHLTSTLRAATPILLVQSASTSNNASGGTLTRTFTSANAAGNLIVVAISFDTNSGTTWSCSDSLGNTYTKATGTNDVRHQQLLGICYASNVKAGANTVS
jgi:hypothetical protein